MVSSPIVILIFLIYIGLLWCLALWTQRFAAAGRSLVNNPVVYSFSLAVFCSSWTFFGSVGLAATSGMLFMTIYLGPTLIVLFWGVLLRKMVRLKTNYRITSIADFISARYDKSETLAATVTLVALVGTIPYVALQLKAVLSSFAVITARQNQTDGLVTTHVGAFVVSLMILFTIMFGVRRLVPTERHEGMVMAVAAESMIKLIALITAGVFVTYGLFDGVGDIFNRVAANPQLAKTIGANSKNTSLITWTSYMIMAANAVMCLPRQFHIAVVENQSESHIRWAIWLFPLYLFIINLFIYPIALAGILKGYPLSQADTFVLRLPLDHGQPYIALLVFIGGFSAATSMIMICSMTMATMISNHLLLPLTDWTPRLEFIARHLLEARWLTVAAFILLGYGFERVVGFHFKLADIGMLSFGAVLQLAPALFGGLFWRGGSLRGAHLGLWAGFIVWSYTLLLPTFVTSGILSPTLLEQGPWGLSFLRPHALFGLNGLNPVAHSLFWSMVFNLGLYILGSLWSEPNQESQSQAETFIGALNGGLILRGQGRWQADIPIANKARIIMSLFSRYFGSERAAGLTASLIDEVGLTRRELASITEIAEFYEHAEKSLGASIGAAMANRALGRAEFFTEREAEELREVYADILTELRASPQDLKRKIDFYQERESLINKHAEELEDKIVQLQDQINRRLEAEASLSESEERYRLAIEGSSDGVAVINDTKIIWGNRRLPEIFDYPSLDDIIGKSLSIIVHPEDRQRVFEISRLGQNGIKAPSRYDFKGIKKDGSSIYIAVSATTINYHGQTLYMTYLRDVTSRRMAEEEIHNLSRRLIEGIEEERRRLAADLHDEFGQALTALHLGVESTKKQLLPDQTDVNRNCDKLIKSIERLAENVRNISSELRPDMLDHLGLVPTVESYINDFRERVKDMNVKFTAAGFGNRKMNSQIEIIIYRILQEALNNVVKHARARRVAVQLIYSHPQIIMVISDDGRGFHQEKDLSVTGLAKRGIGLVSMKERVAAAGGVFDIRSARGKGTTIRVNLPAIQENTAISVNISNVGGKRG